MMQLEAFVTYVDERGQVERVERDDPQGRAAMDTWALDRILDRTVASICVTRTDRIATGGGGYR